MPLRHPEPWKHCSKHVYFPWELWLRHSVSHCTAPFLSELSIWSTPEVHQRTYSIFMLASAPQDFSKLSTVLTRSVGWWVGTPVSMRDVPWTRWRGAGSTREDGSVCFSVPGPWSHWRAYVQYHSLSYLSLRPWHSVKCAEWRFGEGGSLNFSLNWGLGKESSSGFMISNALVEIAVRLWAGSPWPSMKEESWLIYLPTYLLCVCISWEAHLSQHHVEVTGQLARSTSPPPPWEY